MAESTQPKSRFLGTILLTPGSGTAYTACCEQGNLKISGLVPDNHEAILVEDRGEFSTLIQGKQQYPKATFSAYLRDLVDAADVTLVGVCLKRGAYAAATSTLGANRPWTITMLWTIDGTSQGDAANHTCQLEKFRVEDVSFDEDDINLVTISGTVYGTITMT